MRTPFLLLCLVLLCSCGTVQNSYVITGTGTIIGLQVAENPVTQMYSAKFGYARSEMALVPTNGPAVIMELRYSGIFSRSGGIYQRLAVGNAAVMQPGAAFMFAKDADGNISSNAVQAITARMQAIPIAPK